MTLASKHCFGACTMRTLLSLTTIDASSTGLSKTGTEAFGSAWVGSNSSIAYFVGSKIIQPIFGLVGLAFFCLAVYSGVMWMTAQGDSKKIDKAKDILVSATVGLVIVVASYVLTNAILSAITSGSVT